jgi:tRNA A-37 threonylcarbamoyl transferase component Bud32
MPPSTPIICPKCRQANQPLARFCVHCGHDTILNNAGPRYYLTKVIKEGGQGAVYKAVGDDGQTYAVKEMLDQFTDAKERADGVARFAAEAQMMQRLVHPRIPKIYDFFNDEGRHYLAMEFVRGEDLEDIAAREGPIAEARVLAWAAQISDVLQFLHDQNMVYRDMKPSNVMIEAAGTVKLIDLGIAKVFQGNTRGTQIGTPGYAPPEQYQGLATQASDVFALAATIHHLLTGRDPRDNPPFTFPPARSLTPSVSKRTSDALAKALQMRPEDRYPTLAAFRAALGLPKATPAPRPAAPAPVAARPAAASPSAVVTPPPTVAPARPAPSPAAPVAAAPSAPAPARPAPTQPVSTPAAQPAPARAPTQPVAAPRPAVAPSAGPGATAQQQPTQNSWLGWLMMLLLVGGLVAGGAYLLFGGGLGGGTTTTATAMPQTFVARPFTVRNVEITLSGSNSGVGLDAALAQAYLQLARLDCSCDAQLQPGSLTYVNGEGPTELEVLANGQRRYRVSMQGTILVPQ